MSNKFNLEKYIMQNLMMMNALRKDDEIMTFVSLKHDYLIDMIRYMRNINFGDNSYNYICKFIFRNNLGTPLFEIITNENEIMLFLDNVYQFLEFGQDTILYTFNGVNYNMQSYTLTFGFDYSETPTDNNPLKLIVSQYDPIRETMVNRAIIDFDEYSLSDFLNDIYYTFLMDIDGTIDLTPEFIS